MCISLLLGETDYSINNIKRMKIDDEKNLRSHPQADSQVQTSLPQPTQPVPPANMDQQLVTPFER